MNQYSNPEVQEGFHYISNEPEKSESTKNEIVDNKPLAVVNHKEEE